MPNPVEQLADAFKTEAMKAAWPKVSDILKKAGVTTAKFDKLFTKESNVTAMSKEGNKLLVELSQAISDVIFEEFTSKERADEVIAQSQNIKIKSTIRTQLESTRKQMEEAGTKDMKLEQRMVMAGLQSFFEQLKNIDETMVIKAQKHLEKDALIEKGKKAQVTALKPMQINQANDALNTFAVDVNKQKATGKVLNTLAKKAVGVLVKQKIEEEHLEGLFNNKELFNLRNGNAQMMRDEITKELKAAYDK